MNYYRSTRQVKSARSYSFQLARRLLEQQFALQALSAEHRALKVDLRLHTSVTGAHCFLPEQELSPIASFSEPQPPARRPLSNSLSVTALHARSLVILDNVFSLRSPTLRKLCLREVV